MAASLRTLLCSCALLMLSLSICQARDFVVGGNKMSWRIPSSPDEFNKWASRNRFLIGDSIVFKYEPNDTDDSVLQVSKEDYRTCTKSNPIKSFSDGNTKITLDRSGPFYFISGAQGHCEKGQKIEIVVLSPRPDSGDQSIAPSPSDTSDLDDHSPAPSPHQDDHHHHHAPAPAPATHHDDDDHHHHHSPAPSPHHSGAFGLKTGLFMSALGLMSFMAFLV